MEAVTLDDILAVLGPSVVEIVGPVERVVTHPAPIREAKDDGAITFCNKAGAQAVELAGSSVAGTIICGQDFPKGELDSNEKTLILVADPRLSFLRIVKTFFAEPIPSGIHPTAVIEAGAKLEKGVYIGPFTYVGECEIGAGTVIYGHAHIYSKTRIGRNVIVHAGTVIGADGFGFERNEHGELEKFPHVGGVVIEDDVEIGANTCIDRGTLADTIIRQGAKIDNLVHIAHNVIVGRHATVIANAMIGGSTRIGDYAWVAPSASVREGMLIGEGTIVGLGAVVVKDVPDGATVMGTPARPSEEYKALLRELGKLAGGQ